MKGARITVAEVPEMPVSGLSTADSAEDFPAIDAARGPHAAYRDSMRLPAAASNEGTAY